VRGVVSPLQIYCPVRPMRTISVHFISAKRSRCEIVTPCAVGLLYSIYMCVRLLAVDLQLQCAAEKSGSRIIACDSVLLIAPGAIVNL
jgi:hypothetical protein